MEVAGYCRDRSRTRRTWLSHCQLFLAGTNTSFSLLCLRGYTLSGHFSNDCWQNNSIPLYIVTPYVCALSQAQTIPLHLPKRTAVRPCRPIPGTPLAVPAPTGDEALIPMSGSIGPRFSFTHYPQVGMANGPGASLIRPVPDPTAPFVKFLGVSPRGGGGTGFAFGTLGPILGEVGTSTARVLVEVMRLIGCVDRLVVNMRFSFGVR